MPPKKGSVAIVRNHLHYVAVAKGGGVAEAENKFDMFSARRAADSTIKNKETHYAEVRKLSSL